MLLAIAVTISSVLLGLHPSTSRAPRGHPWAKQRLTLRDYLKLEHVIRPRGHDHERIVPVFGKRLVTYVLPFELPPLELHFDVAPAPERGLLPPLAA